MLTVITILLGVFCSAMEALVTATIMPTIISELGGFDLYPWVANSFMLASVATAPFAGVLADTFGYKKCYIGSVLIFLIGSALCGFSGSMHQMIAARVLQGVGSSALLTLSLVLFGALYPIEKRARMQALIGAMWALASLLGPALGAFLTAKFSWQWAFWINIPIGVLIIISFMFGTKVNEPERKNHTMDFSGGLLFTLGALGLVYGLLNLGKLQMVPKDWLYFIGGIALLTYFFRFRKHVEHPFIPLHLIEKKVMFLPIVLAFFTGFFLFSVANFTPLFVQGVLGEVAAVAGKVVTAMAIGSFAGSLLSGVLLNRLGFRNMSTGGVILVAGGFAFLFQQNSHAAILLLMLGNFMVGCGVSLIANANMVAVQAVSPADTLGSATSMVTFARTFGGMIGISMMGGLQLGLFHNGVTSISGTEVIGLVESSQKIFDPLHRAEIDPHYLSQVVEAFTQSLHGVFLGCGAIAALTLIFSLQMPNLTPKEASQQNV